MGGMCVPCQPARRSPWGCVQCSAAAIEVLRGSSGLGRKNGQSCRLQQAGDGAAAAAPCRRRSSCGSCRGGLAHKTPSLLCRGPASKQQQLPPPHANSNSLMAQQHATR